MSIVTQELTYDEAIDAAIDGAMARDERVVVMGEDIHTLRSGLYARYGEGRVMPTPISEAAFVGAGVAAAMAGLRPIVELMMADFAGVAMDAILNHMAKVETFSGGAWRCPMVLRMGTGGGYGDAGQHQQALWGMLGGIPGLDVVVPSTPADAFGLMRTAILQPTPVVFMEHKLLSASWLEFLGRGGRQTVSFDVPTAGARGEVDVEADPTPIGEAAVRRRGDDLTMVSLGVGVHRAIEASERLADDGVSCEVIDLRSVRPLDRPTVAESVQKTGRLLVVDEDYEQFGLSGELAALVLEAGLTPRYARVCVRQTLPFSAELERQALPNVTRIIEVGTQLMH
ncbi:pyruvate dehydrogenase [Persicimonas caeni]|uniref:Pyruvate dehydrogenase n=1 Tax=Persicimonas caeni TaxID=2292766 RepID=A0A4Y6PQZ4_PERCE|nr:transketolase C-terminal domain-containing protein [Persicimonas caeni]QDG50643.1 pyruvate dehydrogenase [Persicimonas caeni]QED31864.1 pyruvate dehydrogenase [Persicimonas caeni]